MPALVLFLSRFAQLLFSGHAAVAVENAALRLQLAAFQRERKLPVAPHNTATSLSEARRGFEKRNLVTDRRLTAGFPRPAPIPLVTKHL